MTNSTPSPARQLLPEWHRQNAVMLTWPHKHSDWAAQLEHIEPVYLDLAHAITRFQPVIIICYDENHLLDVQAKLDQHGIDPVRRILVIAPGNDTWIRDYGPLAVGNTLVDFRFNGWGNKYPHAADDRITGKLARLGIFGDTPIQHLNHVLEGGGIETDGAGTLLTTSRCLLSPTRNPGIDRTGIEQLLGETLGAERILWLEHGTLEGDDTDGHVDMLARFADESTIVYTACDEPGYGSYDSLLRMALQLKEFRTQTGSPYRLVPLPWPDPKFDDDGARLPASYANFLIINGAVLAPVYDDPADDEALRILQTCFPRREVIGIPCLPLIEQYGSLHCATMQIPDTIPVKLT